jgi:hypothetical protein
MLCFIFNYRNYAAVENAAVLVPTSACDAVQATSTAACITTEGVTNALQGHSDNDIHSLSNSAVVGSRRFRTTVASGYPKNTKNFRGIVNISHHHGSTTEDITAFSESFHKSRISEQGKRSPLAQTNNAVAGNDAKTTLTKEAAGNSCCCYIPSSNVLVAEHALVTLLFNHYQSEFIIILVPDAFAAVVS